MRKACKKLTCTAVPEQLYKWPEQSFFVILTAPRARLVDAREPQGNVISDAVLYAGEVQRRYIWHFLVLAAHIRMEGTSWFIRICWCENIDINCRKKLIVNRWSRGWPYAPNPAGQSQRLMYVLSNYSGRRSFKASRPCKELILLSNFRT